MDILIIKLGALGDVINTFPLVINLKQHLNARIHWLVEPLSYPVVSKHPCVDKTILFDKHNWRSVLMPVTRQIRSHGFDITIDCQRILKSGLFCMATKSKRRIGFDRVRCKEMTWVFPFERIPESDPHAHMVYQYLEFARFLGVPSDTVQWDIPVPGNMSFKLPDAYMVLNIGATKPANRWTQEGFTSLADALKKTYNISSVLTGGPEDTETAERISEITGPHVLNLVGRTTLDDLISVINNSICVVTCDTGPMHLAVALNKKVVALFGPSNPGRTGPFQGDIIQKPLHCSPCNARKCDDPVCMSSITHEDVLEKLSPVISSLRTD